MATRKLNFVKEIIFAEAGRAAPRPASRVAAIAVIDPSAVASSGIFPLFDIGPKLSEYGRDRSE
jgi:hypothetical protein